MAALLADRGAAIVDADVLARQVVEPGGPAYNGVARRFPQVVLASGRLDRAALGRVVFADPAARRELEALTHPSIRAAMVSGIVERAAEGATVVAVVPLLAESAHRLPGLDAIVVVDCPPEVVLQRLVARGLTAEEARARMAAQAGREERLALADYVVDNAGDLDELEATTARCWAWIAGLRRDLAR